MSGWKMEGESGKSHRKAVSIAPFYAMSLDVNQVF
jgi:hypothetical protein